LIERARDICRFQGQPLELTPKVLDLAWIGYFGTELPGTGESGKGGKGDIADLRPEQHAEK
jgi:hypothetical protein